MLGKPCASHAWPRTIPGAIAVALVVVAAFLAACGQDEGDLLSQRRASELRDRLDQVQQLAASGDCTAASDAARGLEDEADGLPDGVDSQLREALLSGASRLRTLVEEGCAGEAPSGSTGPTVPAEEPQRQGDDNQGSDQPPGQQKKDEGKGKGKAKGKAKGQDQQDEQSTQPGQDVPPPQEGSGGEDGGSGGFAP